jgi:hypothetical protein
VTGGTPVVSRERDDGLLELLPDRTGGPRPAAAAAAIGVAPWLATVALVDTDTWRLPVGVALAWLLLWGALSRLRPPSGRLDWLVAPALHLAEYVGLARLADLDGAQLDTAFALVAVVVLHHYDLHYRDGGAAQRVAAAVAGGWAGRLAVMYAVAAAGVARPGAAVLAGVVLGVFAVEAARTWKDQSDSDRVAVADLEEPL